MKKNHIRKEERFCIEKMLSVGRTQRDIAAVLGRGISTISEEVRRGGGRQYSAEKAHHRAYFKQYRKKRNCMKVALDPFLARYVEEKLRSYWSPERIAGRLKREHHRRVSAKAIRKFANARRLESFLYRKGKKKKETYTVPINWQEDRVFVDDPRCVRMGYGHWELDFLVSSHSTAVLLVAVERMTRHTIIRWLPNRNNDLVREVVVSALSPFSVQSVTVDNDVAFVKHRELSAALHAPVYFTRPYCSTDKALVENTNRWIRWFIKKKTDLKLVSTEHVEWIEDWLISVPRQCLAFATTREMIELEELKVSGCSY